MRQWSTALVLAAVLVQFVAGQTTTPRQSFQNAVVDHSDKAVKVSCNMPDALQETLRAVREQYGWVVSFEKPAYFTGYDLVDDTAPEWRLKHPQAKGVTRTAGGQFAATYSEASDMSTPAVEEATLNALISQYNISGNPGTFELRRLSEGVYSVVGIAVRDQRGAVMHVSPLLDLRVSIPKQQRTADASVRQILASLSAATGKKVIALDIPTNILRNALVTVGGDNVPARDLLAQTLDATGRPLLWELGYDPDPQIYLLRVEVAMRSSSNGPAKQSFMAIDDPRTKLTH